MNRFAPRSRSRRHALAAVLGLTAISMAPAWAQRTSAVRIIVPFGPRWKYL